jgi:hypothetical protein
MEEDNRIYYNDEWNNITKKVLTKTGNMTFSELNKYFDSFRELACQCSLPKPNSFTGNCINCNKIIKPIIDKDVHKYTK